MPMVREWRPMAHSIYDPSPIRFRLRDGRYCHVFVTQLAWSQSIDGATIVFSL